MDLNFSFWRNKKVFITGHTGFKGSWLCLWLQQLGAEVTGYAMLPPTNPSLFEVARVKEGMVSIIGDIRDEIMLDKAMQEAAPDIVIHMAAQPLVRRSYIDPVETYSTNVIGTVHLFEAVRKTSSVRAVVNVTSDKCYKNKEWVWGYRENEEMGGYDPYSSSKGCAELVTSAYRNSFFNPAEYIEHHVSLASARAGNVIGGGDWAKDRLIPDILASISNRSPVVIRSPQAIRPWQHVLEPLNGYLQLAQKLYEGEGSFAESWNFGPNEEDSRSVQWIVEQFIQYWGSGASWRLDDAAHVHESNYLKLDCSKSKVQLDWHPRFSLAYTLKMIVIWHHAYLKQEDMRKISLEQINEFSN